VTRADIRCSVIRVRSKGQLRRFVRLPWRIYAGDPHWVPPLRREVFTAFNIRKHPFHQHSDVQPYLAVRDGVDVGRICAIHNRNHEAAHGEPVGFFGWFECVEEEAVAASLLSAAKAWLRSRNLKEMRGPVSFSTNDVCGTLIGGEPGPPVIMMAYNPPYYPRLLEAAGLSKAKDLFAWRLSASNPPEHLERAHRVVTERYAISLRRLELSRLNEELEQIRGLYNKAWERNWGFVPMTSEEISHLASELKSVIDPRFAVFAETRSKETIGFALALPDFNQVLRRMNGRLFPFGFLKALIYGPRIKFMRVIILGLLPQWRGKGIDHLLYRALYRSARDAGADGGELSWILEDNKPMNRALERLGGELYRTYRIYSVSL